MKLNVNNITNYDPNINNPLAFTLNSNSKYPSLQSYEFQNVKHINKKIKKVNTNEPFYSKEEKKENYETIIRKKIEGGYQEKKYKWRNVWC